MLSINGVTFVPSSVTKEASGPNPKYATTTPARSKPSPANLSALFSSGLTVKSLKSISSGIV